MAVAVLPWKEIITVLPTLVTTATRLWEQLKAQPRTVSLDPQDDPQKQVAALLQQIELLESAQVAQAALAKEMTEQLQGVSAGLAEVSRRYTFLARMAGGALVLSVSALVVALVK